MSRAAFSVFCLIALASANARQGVKMSGTYKLVFKENFDQFVKAMGTQSANIPKIVGADVVSEISRNGDEWRVKSTWTEPNGDVYKVTDNRFKLDKDFDEETVTGICKSTVTKQGPNVILHNLLCKGKVITNRWVFNGKELVITMQVDNVIGTQTFHRVAE